MSASLLPSAVLVIHSGTGPSLAELDILLHAPAILSLLPLSLLLCRSVLCIFNNFLTWNLKGLRLHVHTSDQNLLTFYYN